MSKLTKAQIKTHAEACRMLEQDRLSEDERYFVLEHWQESAQHINSAAGAFFTPLSLARDLSVEVGDARRVVDLCAGIGALSWFLRPVWPSQLREITCVEVNPAYVAVGRKVLPEARWIEASILELSADVGRFDVAISNPPFGKIARRGRAPRWSGGEFELQVVDIASDIADHGVFILPQMSVPFVYSGERHYRETSQDRTRRFAEVTKIDLRCGAGFDTSIYRREWRTGVMPAVEIATADFVEARAARATRDLPLFAEAAE